MIAAMCLAISFICGLVIAINPKLGVNKEKLKEGDSYEEALDKTRKYGIYLLILTVVLFIILYNR